MAEKKGNHENTNAFFRGSESGLTIGLLAPLRAIGGLVAALKNPGAVIDAIKSAEATGQEQGDASTPNTEERIQPLKEMKPSASKEVGYNPSDTDHGLTQGQTKGPVANVPGR